MNIRQGPLLWVVWVLFIFEYGIIYITLKNNLFMDMTNPLDREMLNAISQLDKKALLKTLHEGADINSRAQGHMSAKGFTSMDTIFCASGKTAFHSLLSLITGEYVSHTSNSYLKFKYTDLKRIKIETVIEFADFMLQNGAKIPLDILGSLIVGNISTNSNAEKERRLIYLLEWLQNTPHFTKEFLDEIPRGYIYSPLMLSVNEKYEKLSLLLIEAGADIHQQSSELNLSILNVAEKNISFDSPLAQRLLWEKWSHEELNQALSSSEIAPRHISWIDWIKSSQDKKILEQLPFEQSKLKNKKVL